jgi:hypothetical protein
VISRYIKENVCYCLLVMENVLIAKTYRINRKNVKHKACILHVTNVKSPPINCSCWRLLELCNADFVVISIQNKLIKYLSIEKNQTKTIFYQMVIVLHAGELELVHRSGQLSNDISKKKSKSVKIMDWENTQ